MSTSNDPATLPKSRTSSSTVASPSVRPRTKRFITGLEDLSQDVPSSSTNTNDSSAAGSPSATFIESPFFPRVPSPIPSKHPSRSSSLRPAASRNAAAAANGSALGAPSNDLATSLSGIWGKSWTSLQAVASNVLGSDPTEPIKDNPNKPNKPRSTASNYQNPGPKVWGPKEQSQPGAGSREERKALVRAKKREELLMQAGRNDVLSTNAAIHYKRRTSDDFESSSMPPGELDNREALVYVHQVTPKDTLAGISIKFNCPMASIKKANGMWTNDGLQVRKTLILPVDNCNVRGRRVEAPTKEAQDVPANVVSMDDAPTPTQASIDKREIANRRGSAATIKPSLDALQNDHSGDRKQADEQLWSHESWILLEGHSDPIEIGRLPRQNLGFFPRARRKSNAYSDADIPSHTNSLDQPRPSIAISDTSSALGGASSGNTSYHRPRRSSSSADFAHRMVGPGGVGTLKGKGPSAPGPAEDKISKVLGNLPNYVTGRRGSMDDPESQQNSRPPSPGYAGHGIDSIGLAVEGFVRKLAQSASRAIQEHSSPNRSTAQSYSHRQQSSRRRGGRVAGASSTSYSTPRSQGARLVSSSSGDLIELEHAFEIGDEEEDEHDDHDFPERGRSRSSGGPTPTNGRVGATPMR